MYLLPTRALTASGLCEGQLESYDGASSREGEHVTPASHVRGAVASAAQPEMPPLARLLGLFGRNPASVIAHLETKRSLIDFQPNFDPTCLRVPNDVHDRLAADPEGGIFDVA